MSQRLNEIRAPIERELTAFERHFRASMRSKVSLLDRITYYIVQRKGKQMRPMFVLLSAKLCGGIQEDSYTAASLIELLHTASLIHDDVVDDAYERRGFFSINALWKNKASVLVGDYLLSRGLQISLERKRYDMLQTISEAMQTIAEGELLQEVGEAPQRMQQDGRVAQKANRNVKHAKKYQKKAKKKRR